MARINSYASSSPGKKRKCKIVQVTRMRNRSVALAKRVEYRTPISGISKACGGVKGYQRSANVVRSTVLRDGEAQVVLLAEEKTNKWMMSSTSWKELSSTKWKKWS